MLEAVWSLVPKGGFGFEGSRSEYEPPIDRKSNNIFNTRSGSKFLSDHFQNKSRHDLMAKGLPF